MDLMLILSGIGAGITFALTGFAKEPNQKFDWMIFGRTVIIGMISGIIMVVLNLPIDAAFAYALNLGLVPLVENILKAIARRL